MNDEREWALRWLEFVFKTMVVLSAILLGLMGYVNWIMPERMELRFTVEEVCR